MKTLSEVYRYAAYKLKEAGIENAVYDAKIIFETVFGVSYSQLVLNPEMPYDEKLIKKLDTLLDERMEGRPLQYIIGEWDFMGFTFRVGEGVLIPRSETEILVEYAVEKLRNVSKPVVFDLCSGSGCIGLSVKKLLPEARIFMIEKSNEALQYLNMNRIELGLARETIVIKGDITKGYDGFSSLPKPDVILSNPPYIKSSDISALQKEVQFEPSMALDGGEDGYDFYKCLAEKWLPYINDDGFIAVECGEEQAEEISRMFENYCSETEILNDYSDIQRIVVGFKEEK